MSKYKKVEVTPRKIEEIKLDAIMQTMLLGACYLMDELEYSGDRICEFWDGVVRYSKAVSDHDITMAKVCLILKEHTGLEIRWNR